MSPVTATRAEIRSFLDHLRTRFLENPSVVAVERTISNKMDTVIREFWQASGQTASGFALFAVGGYGRETVHPQSDIDLLFYFENAIDEDKIKAVLHPLWDLPFQVGHQIRLHSDFAEFDKEQMESYTAFMDARLLVGDAAVARGFGLEVLPDFLRRSRNQFMPALVEMKRERHNRFGQTIFQLEPDLKDAPGGLRDAHWSDWARKALSAARTHNGRVPAEVLAFHHCLRNYLHFHSGRNFNVLSYEFQEQIAPTLGYKDSEHGEAAENLMRDYFLNAAEINRLATAWEEAIVGKPTSISVDSDFRDPFEMVDVFADAHRRKVKIDPATLARIRRRINDLGDALANNPRAGRAVLEMMRDHKGIYDTLLSMHEVGLLGSIFPDFEEIRCRVIRDFFHKYTVDEHSLIAVRNIEELPPKHRFALILNELDKPELLLLSLLFHDIGKAHRHDPGDHVHPSTEGVRDILEKIDLPPDQADRVVFVIQHHLEMSKVILKRDISDDAVIDQFADLVGDLENLRMLTLLTYADVKAVNNEVLTPWKEDLLWQLYVETHNRLTLGLADDQYTQQPAMENEIAGIATLLPPETSPQDIRDFLDGFPRRYLKSTPKNIIAEHFIMSRKLAERPVITHIARRRQTYEMLVMTADRPFLFSKITGVLAYFGMNILRGQAFSNRHGAIFDLITFEDVEDTLQKNPSELERLEKVLNDVIVEKLALEQLLLRKSTSILFQANRGVVPVATSINFEDEFSRRCSIMEIVTQDAFGLLYEISRVISRHGHNIEVVLINTEGHRALDVFYLTHDGRKLTPEMEVALGVDVSEAVNAPN
jgi:[protein-PII] uridylyltransferase